MSSDLANLENAELKEAFDAFDKVSGTRPDRLAVAGIAISQKYSRTGAERFLQRSCWES